MEPSVDPPIRSVLLGGQWPPAAVGRSEWDLDLAVTKSAVTLHRL